MTVNIDRASDGGFDIVVLNANGTEIRIHAKDTDELHSELEALGL